MAHNTDPFEAFKSVDFDWVTRLDGVWSDPSADVPALNFQARQAITRRLDDLIARSATNDRTQLGRVYVGTAGSGKTHFLSFVRKEAYARALNFVFVDMTDVRDFWPHIALGYLDSLLRPAPGGRIQLQLVLQALVTLALPELNAEEYVDSISGFEAARIKTPVAEILGQLGRLARSEVLAYGNVVRALLILNSHDSGASSTAYSWLQGVPLEKDQANELGLTPRKQSHSVILKGLSWAMGLRAPTVLAFDQLDAIVAQYHLAAGGGTDTPSNVAQQAALAIIMGVVSGVAAIVDQTTRTLPIITATNNTWQTLLARGLDSAKGRFDLPPTVLKPIVADDVARAIVEARLAAGYRRARFQPPYETWPFKPKVFEGLVNTFPREVLQICADYQKRCSSAGVVSEVQGINELRIKESVVTVDGGPDKYLRFEELFANATPDPALIEEDGEDTLGDLILHGCELLLKESDPPNDVDRLLDADFSSNRRFPPLHTRVRTVFHSENDREEHTCIRVLQRTNYNAYKARLSAAMTAAGVDRGLAFRKLIIVRSVHRPPTPAMAQLTEEFERRGGRLAGMTALEAAKLKALVELSKEKSSDFYEWLRLSRPVSSLGFFGDVLSPLESGQANGKPAAAKDPPSEPVQSQTTGQQNPGASAALSPGLPATVASTSAALDKIPGIGAAVVSATFNNPMLVGSALVGGKPGPRVHIDPRVLSRHTIIRAGAGGGKTVLLKRLVEEAAIAGVPSIIIDVANDLTQIGDPWPTEPQTWLTGDRERARFYHDCVEVVIWTPGRNVGRPLQFNPLPDLAAVAGDEDELNSAIEMAVGALERFAVTGRGSSAQKKLGVLASALRYFARNGAGGIEELTDLLSDLPIEAGGGITKSAALAEAIADGLRAAMQLNPLLHGVDHAMRLEDLFGLGASRTRISVISMVGLPSATAQQDFVNQLAMALFSWMKHHPSVGPHGMTGLLVIDEAKDFLPGKTMSPSKKSLMLLAAQARKYGLGLLMATQNPMDLDYNAVANFSTQFFGKANSPQVIEFIKKMIEDKGGSGADIGRLEKGQFYMISEGIRHPTKLTVPMCLSHHPDNKPLTEEEIISRARTGVAAP
jgi:DNA helicase HerA-like ATPase